MPFESDYLTLANPVFHTYLLAASIMLLKLMLQPWITVQRMMKVRAGFRSPEDAKQTPLNPEPREGQLEPNEYVERSRRMNLNDLESIPGFLIAGLLFVLAGPPVLFGQILIWTYPASTTKAKSLTRGALLFGSRGTLRPLYNPYPVNLVA